MKKFALLAAALVFAGACGDEDTSVESVSGAIPSETFKGKVEQVLIIGNDTDWQPGATVDFGEGVTVESVMVASPTALVVSISTDGTTPAGVRDVTVNGAFTLAGGFEVLEATSAASQGTVAQGSISVVTIDSLDLLTAFDTTSTGDGFFTPLEFTNIAFDGLPQGTLMNVGSVTSYQLSATLVVDVNAAGGTYNIDIVSGPPENQVRIPAEITIGERAPVALTADTPLTDTVRGPFDSQLYSFTVPSGAVAELNLNSLSPNQSQSLNVLGSSGSFTDVVNFGLGTNAILPAGDYYAVLWDNSGETDFDFTLTPFVSNMPTAAAEAEPNDDATNPQALSLPGQVDSATMSLTDDDVYSITIGPENMGQVICVGTFGNPQTDTTVEVVRLEQDNSETPIAASSDAGFQDALITGALDTEGTYLIKVRPSSFHQEGLPVDYQLAVWTE